MDHAKRVHGLSQRRACRLIGMDVSSYRYRSKRPDDGPLRERLRALASVRRRFGYRRLGWLLLRRSNSNITRHRINSHTTIGGLCYVI